MLGVDKPSRTAHTYYSYDDVSVDDKFFFSCGNVPEFQKGECRDIQVVVAKRDSDGWLPVQRVDFESTDLRDGDQFGSIKILKVLCPCEEDIPTWNVSFKREGEDP